MRIAHWSNALSLQRRWANPRFALTLYVLVLSVSLPLLSSIQIPITPGQNWHLTIIQLTFVGLLLPLTAFAACYPQRVYLIALLFTAIHDLVVVISTAHDVPATVFLIGSGLVLTSGLCELIYRVMRARTRLLTALTASEAALRARMAELEGLHAQVAELSYRDGLTGIYNRRALNAELSAAIAEAQATDSTLCVALFDVDDFKAINDRLSHQVGDATLQGVAEILRYVFEPRGYVARYGGEEFAVVLRDCAIPEAVRLCEAARSTIDNHEWARIDPALRVTISGGVADNRHFSAAQSPEAQIRLADDRLYQAKRRGKNRILAVGATNAAPLMAHN